MLLLWFAHLPPLLALACPYSRSLWISKATSSTEPGFTVTYHPRLFPPSHEERCFLVPAVALEGWQASGYLVAAGTAVAMPPSLFTQQTFAEHLPSAEQELDPALNQRR